MHLLRWGGAQIRSAARQTRRPTGATRSEPPSPRWCSPSAELQAAFSVRQNLEAPALPARPLSPTSPAGSGVAEDSEPDVHPEAASAPDPALAASSSGSGVGVSLPPCMEIPVAAGAVAEAPFVPRG
eukprot:15351635-Alexandrium_andersonii.AAC.1